MVGLDVFREFFKEYYNCYIAIGGSACDDYFEGQGLEFRTTDDIDIILVVEAVDDSFITHFWKFVEQGGYKKAEHAEDIQYYRFSDPIKDQFPSQIELFSRTPDLLKPIEEGRYTTIPANEDISSLSAILMDEEYYAFTKQQSIVVDDFSRANEIALICLKAKAYLDLSERRAKGEEVNRRKINKHRQDIFVLAATLTQGASTQLQKSVMEDLRTFIEEMEANPPDIKQALKNAKINTPIAPKTLLTQLRTTFNLND
tara:strand:- start:2773 stop:3543 length:771 start_codon:yes stop_codon:yes gene_type:complete